MTVAQLIARLQELPPDLNVYVYASAEPDDSPSVPYSVGNVWTDPREDSDEVIAWIDY